MVQERECIGSWWGDWKEGDQWGDLGIDGLGRWHVEVRRGGCKSSWWGNRSEGDPR